VVLIINGIEVKSLKVNLDDRGWLYEFARSDDEFFKEIEKDYQINVSHVFLHTVKAWHRHQHQYDYVTCITGNAMLCVVNDRDVSKENAVEINKFFIGEKNQVIVKIPPRLWHGYMTLEGKSATLLYMTSKPYNYSSPDEERKNWDSFGDIWKVINK